MDPAPAEMRRIVGKSDYIVLDTACQRVSLTALKLHDRGRLTEQGMTLTLAVVRRVRQLMPKQALYWLPLPPPIPPFPDRGSMAWAAPTWSGCFTCSGAM